MTISSSLNAGVTGLNVNASRLATISDNIANSATFGYKRSVADFHSLVLNQSRGSYSAGGVRVTTERVVDQRGTLISTNNSTDLAVAGQGMLPVTPISQTDEVNGEIPMRLTSTGSFRPDDQGILRTASGQALLGWPADMDGNIPQLPRDTVGGLVPVQIDTSEFVGDATSRITLGVNLPATDTEVGADGTPRTMALEYFGNLGEPQNLDITYSPVLPTPPSTTATNQWNVTLNDGAQGGALVGEFLITFDSTRDFGGTIATVVDGAAGTYDEDTGLIEVNVQGGPLEVDIGRPLETRGLSQLSHTFAPLSVTKDGSPVGTISGVEVDEGGLLVATYNTGFTKTLYQIPVVVVPNVNGLQPLSDQTYQVSSDSGPFYLWDAGSGPVGSIASYSREESATDVASELTQLIQTQRAYNSNAKVIQTVDEMLQETTNIKR